MEKSAHGTTTNCVKIRGENDPCVMHDDDVLAKLLQFITLIRLSQAGATSSSVFRFFHLKPEANKSAQPLGLL
jgi:hypothetical protein